MAQTNPCPIIDVTQLVAAHVHPSSILSYVARTRPKMTVLICENMASFAHVRRLMKEGGQRRFFGTRIDAVACGADGVFTKPWGLSELERSLGDANGLCYTALGGAYRPRVNYLYWGDISRSSVMGILDLYRANPGRTIRPFAAAYRCMLDLAFGRSLPEAPEVPASSFLMRLERYFTPMQQSTYRTVLAAQQRIPQGIVTERRLRNLARKAC